MSKSIIAVSETPSADAARRLAREVQLPLCAGDCAGFRFVLRYENEHLELIDTTQQTGGPLWIDFAGGRAGHRRQFGGGRGQPLARAIGLKGGANPTVVDATAGLGRDGFVLACLGARVTWLERSPIIAALLADGLARAQRDPELGPLITDHLRLITPHGREWLQACPPDERPEVIYLDPMYPGRSKSALVKKEMRFLQELVGKDDDAPALLAAALRCATKRVVVKRPASAPPLEGPKPAGAVASENTRYDIYSTLGASTAS
jgi:16S rRNA (guanine1516-N2)-methyltransferase